MPRESSTLIRWLKHSVLKGYLPVTDFLQVVSCSHTYGFYTSIEAALENFRTLVKKLDLNSPTLRENFASLWYFECQIVNFLKICR